MKSALSKDDQFKAKRYGEIALKKLPTLFYSPLDEYFLYTKLGAIYYKLGEYSRSLNILYKASLIAAKKRFKPVYIAHISYIIGYIFLSLKNIKQAFLQFYQVEQYYQKYGDNFSPMNEQIYVSTIFGESYCYLYQGKLRQSREIIENKLHEHQEIMHNNNMILIEYYHLKGECLMAENKYDQAKQSFRAGLKVSEQFNKPLSAFKTRLAWLELLEGNIDESIEMLQDIIRNTRRLKQNKYLCAAGLLLSKCYSLKKMSHKATAIEMRIKSVLNKLDILWFYEKSREFEQLYQQLQKVYHDSNSEFKSIPAIITNTLNQHYEKSDYKHIIIGQSLPMRDIYQMIEKIAPTDLPILIQGETGTGKELVASALHHNSLRSKKYYLAINCGAIPETLLESELFGHVKGAFTDAKEDRRGYIELVSEGTLFIDEIAEMSPAMQQKLLRVIEDKQIWRLGAEKPISVNTRFIFASNQNIEEFVKAKKFRQDLFYRINTIVITLPPLRDRKDDIPLLVQHFLEKYTMLSKSEIRSSKSEIAPDALALLQDYSWPGNIRELENEIKRICVLYPWVKQIVASLLHESIRIYKSSLTMSLSATSLKEARKLAEKNLIADVIKRANGNIRQSARLLGCSRRYLQRKMRQLKI
jgi:transcriptional regulator with PAS, ATPase and Fis domain